MKRIAVSLVLVILCGLNLFGEDLNFKVMSFKGDTKNLTLSFEVRNSNENVNKAIEKNKSQLVNLIALKLEARSFEELSTIGGKQFLKSDIIEIIHSLAKDNTELEIFFTKFTFN